jgi:glycosyltransferase involved in cell wall biosynthesis
MARVQIVLPSHNRRDLLREALESVLAQTSRDFHILVVDDASTDGAAELAHDYHERSANRITLVRNPQNTGMYRSCNLALSLSRDYELLALLDDDDIWEPAKLERQIEVLDREQGTGLVATEARLIDVDGRATGTLLSDLHGGPSAPSDTAHRIFVEDNFLCASSVIIRNRLLEVTGYQVQVATANLRDLYLWLIVSAQAHTHWIREPLTSYRVSPSSAINTMQLRTHHDHYLIRQYAYDNFECVRRAVGGMNARRKPDGNMLYWTHTALAARDLGEYDGA